MEFLLPIFPWRIKTRVIAMAHAPFPEQLWLNTLPRQAVEVYKISLSWLSFSPCKFAYMIIWWPAWQNEHRTLDLLCSHWLCDPEHITLCLSFPICWIRLCGASLIGLLLGSSQLRSSCAWSGAWEGVRMDHKKLGMKASKRILSPREGRSWPKAYPTKEKWAFQYPFLAGETPLFSPLRNI